MTLTPYQEGYSDGFLKVARRSTEGDSPLDKTAYNHGYSVGTRDRKTLDNK